MNRARRNKRRRMRRRIRGRVYVTEVWHLGDSGWEFHGYQVKDPASRAAL